MIRLFIALEIPEEIRKYITGERKRISDIDLRWEPVEKLHLTLKFIGSFKEELLNDLIKELSFIENYPEFELQLTNFGFFKPRIIWVGLSAGEKLFKLADDLNKHLVKLNIETEEKLFKPHLTLLRIPKGQENIIESFRGKQIMNKSFNSDRVILYQSTLSPQGSKYTPLKVYKLRKQVKL